VNLHDLDNIGVRAIHRSVDASDVVVIDEIGPMELHSDRFIQAVRAAVSSPKHVLATIHKRTKHPFVMALKSNPGFTIFEVTVENREELPLRIVEKIRRWK
jgi:nucleoside-triphosphatase